MVVQNQQTNAIETIEMVQSTQEEPSQDDVDAKLLSMLFIKERYGVSHSAYHEMAKLCKQLPRQCQLQKKIKELNEKWEIEKIPNDIPGVQQKLEPRLRDRIQILIVSTPEDVQFKRNKKIRVKLSGDGTTIGTSMLFSISIVAGIIMIIKMPSVCGVYIHAL